MFLYICFDIILKSNLMNTIPSVNLKDFLSDNPIKKTKLRKCDWTSV